MPKGKPYPAEFRARATIEVMHAKKTVNELTFEHDLKPQPGQELARKGYL